MSTRMRTMVEETLQSKASMFYVRRWQLSDTRSRTECDVVMTLRWYYSWKKGGSGNTHNDRAGMAAKWSSLSNREAFRCKHNFSRATIFLSVCQFCNRLGTALMAATHRLTRRGPLPSIDTFALNGPRERRNCA